MATGDTGRQWDSARFYTIAGHRLPSVTTILDVIAKPGLGPWYAKEERRYFEAAMLEVLAKPGARDPDYVLAAVAEAVTGVKAAERDAADARRRLARRCTPGSNGSFARAWARMPARSPGCPTPPRGRSRAGRTGRSRSTLEPLGIERVVACPSCGYAGTLDLYARIQGILTVLDWKSGKAIYPEAFLQNVAYRHAAKRHGWPSSPGPHRPAPEAAR